MKALASAAHRRQMGIHASYTTVLLSMNLDAGGNRSETDFAE
jgi:hypothetical protein